MENTIDEDILRDGISKAFDKIGEAAKLLDSVGLTSTSALLYALSISSFDQLQDEKLSTDDYDVTLAKIFDLDI